MMESHVAGTLLQRIDLALHSALRNDSKNDFEPNDGRRWEPKRLLIKGVAERVWPLALERVRLDTPHSSMALVINSFFPWEKDVARLPLAGKVGFDAIQFTCFSWASWATVSAFFPTTRQFSSNRSSTT